MSKQSIFEVFGMVMAFLGIGIAYLAIHLGIRQERFKRELEHKERMRAMELGRDLPGDKSRLSPLRIGFLTSLIVPVSTMTFAWLSTIRVGYNGEIWRFSAAVSLAAVICGTVIVCLSVTRNLEPVGDPLAHKPETEEDAYDVVSARG